MSDQNIIYFNTQGIQGINKRIGVLEYLKDKNFNIYCLQDTHFTKDDVDKIKVQWGKDYVMSTFRSNARGVAVLFGKDIELSIHKQVIDEGGNFIILDITIFKQRLTLVNLYGPNEDDPMFFQNLANHIDIINNEKFILCGDYNCILDPLLDCYNYTHINNPKARDKLIEMVETYNMIDPFRDKYPTLKRYTWRKNTPLKQARLDYFLISAKIMQYVKKCKIDMAYRSGHSVITLEFQFDDIIYGKSYWKHNNSLFTDKEYLDIINKHIKEIKRQYAIPIYII